MRCAGGLSLSPLHLPWDSVFPLHACCCITSACIWEWDAWSRVEDRHQLDLNFKAQLLRQAQPRLAPPDLRMKGKPSWDQQVHSHLTPKNKLLIHHRDWGLFITQKWLKCAPYFFGPCLPRALLCNLKCSTPGWPRSWSIHSSLALFLSVRPSVQPQSSSSTQTLV